MSPPHADSHLPFDLLLSDTLFHLVSNLLFFFLSLQSPLIEICRKVYPFIVVIFLTVASSFLPLSSGSVVISLSYIL